MALSRVLLIICDDLAYGDLSLHGNPHVKTPRIDSLAVEGARCTRYLSGPLCTPARAALMTGRHPYRTRAIDTYLGRSMLDPNEPTLAKMFGQAGWRCGLFGKWHLGDTVPSRPNDQGFHEALYHTGGGLRQPANHGRDSYFNPELRHNGQPVESQGYCTDVFTNAAIDFIRQADATPWFCYLAFNTPHSPMEIADRWVQPLRRPDLPEPWARLYGMVSNIDYNVGRLLDVLQELGMREDTLVIFTSDHGPCGSLTVDGRIRYNAGLRGRKGEMYEGGIKVPFFARWPAIIQPATITETLMNPIDLLPTLAAAAGMDPPVHRIPDGQNLLPALLDGQLGTPHPRKLCMQWHRGNQPERYRNAVTITHRWKWYRREPDGPDELYDLVTDPAEQQECATAHPDIVAELRRDYEDWFRDVSHSLGSTPAENYAPIRIPIGDPREPAPWLTRQDWRRPDGAVEGWADDQPGDWLLDIRRAGPHLLTLEFGLVATDNSVLEVRCGLITLQRPISRRVSVEQFDNLLLPIGPCRLAVRLIEADPHRICGVRFARLHPPPICREGPRQTGEIM